MYFLFYIENWIFIPTQLMLTLLELSTSLLDLPTFLRLLLSYFAACFYSIQHMNRITNIIYNWHNLPITTFNYILLDHDGLLTWTIVKEVPYWYQYCENTYVSQGNDASAKNCNPYKVQSKSSPIHSYNLFIWNILKVQSTIEI